MSRSVPKTNDAMMTVWNRFFSYAQKRKYLKKNVPEERRKHFSNLIPNLCKFSQNNDAHMFSCLYVWRYYCAEFKGKG